jgi:hypothetical protein
MEEMKADQKQMIAKMKANQEGMRAEMKACQEGTVARLEAKMDFHHEELKTLMKATVKASQEQ